MSRSKRKSYHHGDLRRALLDEARKLVEDEGPSAVSFRKLAEALDVSHAAPLAHFRERLSLDAALATEAFREVRTRCEDLRIPPPGGRAWSGGPHASYQAMAAPAAAPLPATPASSPRPELGLLAMRLVTAALVYLRFALEHPGLFRVMYAPELSERLRGAADAPSPDADFRELAEEKARALEVFATLVRQGQEVGEFRRELRAEQAARLVLALTEGLAHQYLDEKTGIGRLKEAERLLELFMRGILG